MAYQMTTDDFNSWDQYIQGLHQQEDLKLPTKYEELFDVNETDYLIFREGVYAGLSPMQVVDQLGSAIPDSLAMGFQTNFTSAYYRKVVAISKTLLDTNKTADLDNFVTEQMRNLHYSRSLNLFGWLRNAANSTGKYALTWGTNLLSVKIPLKNSGTTSITTFVDGKQRPLSYSAFDLLTNALASQTSDSGNIIEVNDDFDNDLMLITSYNNKVPAFEIAEVSERPDTADRSENYFVHGAKCDLLLTNFIGYKAAVQAGETTVSQTSASNNWDSSWFVIRKSDAKRYWRMFKMKGYEYYDTEINKANESINHFSYDSYSSGVLSPLGFVGSLGDNSTITT